VLLAALALVDFSRRARPLIRVVTHPAFRAELRRRVPAAVRSRIARTTRATPTTVQIAYTLGTTGKPKGAVRKAAKDGVLTALRIINRTPLHVADVHLVACPLHHAAAQMFATLAQVLGNTVVTTAEFSAPAFFALAAQEGVTTTALVPSMLQQLLAYAAEHEVQNAGVGTTGPGAPRTLGAGLRVVFSCGAPLAPAVSTAFMNRFGDVLWNVYGAIETGMVSLASPRDLRAYPGTVGYPLDGVAVRLLSPDHAPSPAGAVGELYVRSTMVAEGYDQDPVATVASRSDGYFGVGDLAKIGAAGELYLLGRTKDCIRTDGVNVYPAAVEAALLAHSAIAEVAVLGLPDSDGHDLVCAILVRKPGSSVATEELRAYLNGHLDPPQCPKRYEFVRALPTGPTGKVNKQLLAAEFAGA
jgi:acyl-CoA synthetase (AMP-forming)/AMP-acid ligase II